MSRILNNASLVNGAAQDKRRRVDVANLSQVLGRHGDKKQPLRTATSRSEDVLHPPRIFRLGMA